MNLADGAGMSVRYAGPGMGIGRDGSGRANPTIRRLWPS